MTWDQSDEQQRSKQRVEDSIDQEEMGYQQRMKQDAYRRPNTYTHQVYLSMDAERV
jgi:hypothetical protein